MTFHAKRILFPSTFSYRKAERFLSQFFKIGVIESYTVVKVGDADVTMRCIDFNYFEEKAPLVLEEGMVEVAL